MRAVPVLFGLLALPSCAGLLDWDGFEGAGGLDASAQGDDDARGRDPVVDSGWKPDAAVVEDAATEPDVDAGEKAPIRLLQVKTLPQTGGTQIPVTIGPTAPGSLVVVFIAEETSTNILVSNIADSASNSYVSAGHRSVDVGCNDSMDIWFAKNTRAGATTMTITMSAAARIEAWVIELSGLSLDDPFDVGAIANNQPESTTIVAPPVTPSQARSVVLSVGMACGNIQPQTTNNPRFTPLAFQNGHNVAYLITNERGTFNTSWPSDLDSWNAATVAFR